MNKNNWEGIKFPSEKGDWKNLRIIIPLIVCMLKKNKNMSCLYFKK